MSKKKGNGKIIAAAVIATGMVVGTAAAGIILPQTNYVSITYYGNNGTVVEQRVRKNSAVSLPTPERAGCNFAGWYFNEEMTDAVTYGTKFNANTRVYAGWEVEDYAIATQADATGIISIGAGAFKGCTGLTSVTIPESVTSIGANAFEGCNLTNLYIEGDIYTTATSVSSLGGALANAKNVYVKEAAEHGCRNNYFLEGNKFYYKETVNNYVHFLNDSEQETKFNITYYDATGGVSIGDECVRYRGSAVSAPERTEITNSGIMKTAWCDSYTCENVITLTEITSDLDAYRMQYRATFNDCTWDEVKQISNLGYQSNCFEIGDEKVIVINDTANNLTFNLTIQIADFNHDIDANGNTVGITFVTKELLPSKYNRRHRTSSTNTGGWDSSDIRTYLNSNIYNLLPADLCSSITAVKKSTAGGSSSELRDSVDKLFLLSMAEINYDAKSMSWVSANVPNYKNEGTPYALFLSWDDANSENDILRVKKYADSGVADFWWLRSPEPYFIKYFMGVLAKGYVESDTANTVKAICFGFCI